MLSGCFNGRYLLSGCFGCRYLQACKCCLDSLVGDMQSDCSGFRHSQACRRSLTVYRIHTHDERLAAQFADESENISQ